MATMNRRSVIRASLGSVAAGALVAPISQPTPRRKPRPSGRCRASFPRRTPPFARRSRTMKKRSGNKIDFSIMPFQALNQKAISALTSGAVPDLIFHDAPATILPQNAWNDKLVDVSDIVEAYKSQLSETAILELQLLQQRHQAAELLSGAGQAGGRAVPHLGRPRRQSRLKLSRRAEDLGRVLGLLQAGADRAARQRHAQAVCSGLADHHGRTERRQRPVRPFPDRQRRRRHRHPRRQAAHRRSPGARGGDPVGRMHDQRSTRMASCRRRR